MGELILRHPLLLYFRLYYEQLTFKTPGSFTLTNRWGGEPGGGENFRWDNREGREGQSMVLLWTLITPCPLEIDGEWHSRHAYASPDTFTHTHAHTVCLYTFTRTLHWLPFFFHSFLQPNPDSYFKPNRCQYMPNPTLNLFSIHTLVLKGTLSQTTALLMGPRFWGSQAEIGPVFVGKMGLTRWEMLKQTRTHAITLLHKCTIYMHWADGHKNGGTFLSLYADDDDSTVLHSVQHSCSVCVDSCWNAFSPVSPYRTKWVCLCMCMAVPTCLKQIRLLRQTV